MPAGTIIPFLTTTTYHQENRTQATTWESDQQVMFPMVLQNLMAMELLHRLDGGRVVPLPETDSLMILTIRSMQIII